MKRLTALLMLSVLLSACGGQSEQQQVKEGAAKKEQVEQDKQAVKKPVKVNYRTLTKKQLTAYLKAMPRAFNEREYKQISKYIKKNSEAEKYIKKTIKSGQFDHYYIERFTIKDVTVKGSKTKATVTRVMSSEATGEQLTEVVTVFDLSYDKAEKTMLITDFNDKSVQRVNQETATTEQPASEAPTSESPTSENTTTEQPSTEAVTTEETQTDCAGCAGTDSNESQEEQIATEKPATNMTVQEAQKLVESRYRKAVEDYNDDADVKFTYTSEQPEEDAGGSYYHIQAIDRNLPHENLLQSFKVYIDSKEVVAE
ncbi:TcaA NTF2-like domain-containing protein [Macrococcus lamae]|uniref:TcaA protein NTF2-like domain-containing protein n=1 Tax=Macrococcus lamae TaxID=198484 RepID=A0A4V3BEY6_9STAP|nr:hypothetical protein [Macrococcus lamae]TDM11947.1 hypothetical protein ERX29_04970 [Macrococcus lamae]